VAAPRWLVDEMLGRLARYLRFLGHDTVYVKGVTDDALVALARSDSRTLLTRDRTLAGRLPNSLLIVGVQVGEQLREVHHAFPEAGYEVSFVRCSLCNGRLRAWVPPPQGPWPTELPRERVERGMEVYECPDCGHLYWEGSHTEQIRRHVLAWTSDRAR
jgi:uncharacterized protein